jgi:hypothetical protein
MNYKWDPKKAASNHRKHNIDFSDAIGVFEDKWALTCEDTDMHGEQRFITIGTDFLGRILVVIYMYREDNIRLISARTATKAERKEYEKRRV